MATAPTTRYDHHQDDIEMNIRTTTTTSVHANPNSNDDDDDDNNNQANSPLSPQTVAPLLPPPDGSSSAAAAAAAKSSSPATAPSYHHQNYYHYHRHGRNNNHFWTGWLDSFRRDPGGRVSLRVDYAAWSSSQVEAGGGGGGGVGGGGGFDVRAANFGTANSPLAKELKGRHLQMIAIGGSIGTGLFVASGKALYVGGPAAVLVAYGMTGTMMFCVVQALGELSVAFPVSGSFSSYATRFLDPSWGFAMGWNYALQWLMVMPLEVMAASITIGYWNNVADHAIFVTVFLVVITTINLLGVKAFGEAEFACAIVKVGAVIGFILLGVVINVGGGGGNGEAGSGGYVGGRYWSSPGAFHNGLKGLCSVFVSAALAFWGTELVGLAAAETANPRKSLPTAIKQVFWRITLFYIAALALVGLLVPYDDPRLMGARSVADPAASPFVLAIQSAGIEVLPSVMNAVVLVAVFSVGNSAIFGSSRTLAALADQGQAPRALAYVDRRGRPLVAVLVASAFGLLAYLADMRAATSSATSTGATTATTAVVTQDDVFEWLMALSTLSALFTWASVCLAHIRFRRAWRLRGRPLSALAFRAQAGAAGSWLGLAVALVILAAQFWTAGWPLPEEVGGARARSPREAAQYFFLQYLSAPLVLACYLAHKWWFGTRPVPLADIDVDTGRMGFNLPVLEAREREEMEAWPRWKKLYRFLC